MASFNKVILIGYVTADPELRQTQGGESVTSFSIGVNRRFAKNGECDFINVVAWRQNAEFVTRYFKKGSPILVCGQLQTRSWTDNQGQKRYATEVVADEVAFVGQTQATAEIKKEPPAQTQGLGYVPEEYKQTVMSFLPRKEQTQEELPNDGSLPF